MNHDHLMISLLHSQDSISTIRCVCWGSKGVDCWELEGVRLWLMLLKTFGPPMGIFRLSRELANQRLGICRLKTLLVGNSSHSAWCRISFPNSVLWSTPERAMSWFGWFIPTPIQIMPMRGFINRRELNLVSLDKLAMIGMRECHWRLDFQFVEFSYASRIQTYWDDQWLVFTKLGYLRAGAMPVEGKYPSLNAPSAFASREVRMTRHFQNLLRKGDISRKEEVSRKAGGSM